jgi:hypothetical protein
VKRCGLCGEVKPLEAFHRRGGSRQTWCKPCRRRYDAEYHRRRRELRVAQARERRADQIEWFRALKENRPCAECGGVFHHAAMHWDHQPGFEKLSEVSSMVHRTSRSRILAEIAKCELVCANCHAVRSFQQLRGVAQPG